ncbi:MAG: laccase domain-containing protein, partial [Bdellovibrionales bacterium]|nr:laccase domain-containing protein [Bdellovibrionales bacterium]
EAESIRCVALGPSADPSLYEVGEEFEEYFGESGAVAIVNGKRTFDLHREAKFQLEKAQYQGPIDEVSCCTMSDSSYYSHRCNPEGRRRNYTVAIFL